MMFVRLCRLLFTLTVITALSIQNVVANPNPHLPVRDSLIHLSGYATAQSGGLAGVSDGLQSQATGFVVGGDGFILTTNHFLDPLKKEGGVNFRFEAMIKDVDTRKFPLQFVTNLPNLDLALFKARIPFGEEKWEPLKLGSSGLIDRTNLQEMYTSGFHGNEYRQRKAEYNAESSSAAPYVWSMNIKTNGGQSGSPVYLQDGTVVGLIKGVKREDDELTLVIPVEYSLPLIGHFRIEKMEQQLKKIAQLESENEQLTQKTAMLEEETSRLDENIKQLMALESKVSTLVASIGESATPGAPPIQHRLGSVEKNLEEIGGQFFWTAETDSNDSSLKIRYEKLVSDGPQIDSIAINVKANMRRTDGVVSPRKLRMRGGNTFVRIPTREPRSGEFVIPNFQAALEGLYFNDADAKGKPDPYSDIEVNVVPSFEGEDLAPERIKLVPKYNWKDWNE